MKAIRWSVLAVLSCLSFCTVDSPGAVIYSNYMSTNPGWTTSGQWAWGTPTGSAGDPTSGKTGTKVYGYNLSGAYANNISSAYLLTTKAINCSGYTGIHLKFYRWLGVDSSNYDHANVQVSNNGSTWTYVWSNSTTTINETAWSLQDIDISAYADNQSTVYIRWGMGTTNGSTTYCGWNIDDVSLTTPPNITSITPNSGMNTGSVNITNLAGINFQEGATVKLTKTGQPDVNATEIIVDSSASIRCTFDLSGTTANGLWNVVITNPNGESATLTGGFTIGKMIYLRNMDTNPGWTVSGGQWAWGTPTGSAGDPTSGCTGTKVYGYNLSGAYANNISSTYWATTQAINCYSFTGVHLKFYRWLGMDGSTYDHAYIQVSNNGSTWADVWSNSTTTINDTGWSLQDIDISAYADKQSTVYIRWGIGSTNSSTTYCGWNIDDVSLIGSPPPTVTSITPYCGMNAGIVNITNLAGTNFQTGATVKLLKTGQTPIDAANVMVVSSNKITCTFDLTNKAPGAWNVVVTNSDTLWERFYSGFTIGQFIYYVTPAGNDSNSGLSWSSAKKTVTAGLNAAMAGDQVWVAAGTYNEQITLKEDVALYGGFAEIETDPAQRNITGNPTILDGQQNGSVVSSPSGAYIATRIDGFTIRNGTGKLSGSYREGGGIYCDNSSPTISNNIISGNSAFAGGGIYCKNSSYPTISNNTINGNSVEMGGGIYCYNSSAPTISNNIISRNSASDYGGGIYCSAASPTISNNTLSGNITSNCGGAIYCSTSSPNISNNKIGGNSAEDGGGIFCEYSASPTISSNTISQNNASNGGGIYCSEASSPTIANNIISFNSTGIYKTSEDMPVLRNNCVFNPSGANYTGLSAGSGDINENPRLEAVEYGKYHLNPDSPCINTGNDAYVQSGQVDMDGLPRIVGTHADIGADEYDGTAYSFTPTIIRISTTGSDANDGSTWALAKRTVQAGIDAAVATGGEVWVAEGTYNERITLLPFAYLYGGFVGTETQHDQRNFKIHQTILDGQQGGSVVTTTVGHQVSGIDGFTIRNGNATSGGGVCCWYSSPTIRNNIISGNSASGDYGYGGGILCFYSYPTISNNTISANNASYYGGGIYCDDISSSSYMTISNNTIRGNIASYGGGIACLSSSPRIRNNTISGNSASYYGGGVLCLYSSPTISNNMISGNIAPDGGGIYYRHYSTTIANNIIAFNSTGIYKEDSGTSAPVLRNNCVYNPNGYDYSGLSAGTNDIQQDPLFVTQDQNDFHIRPDSNCIDAGNDADVEPGQVDMDGQARINGSHVDIGADEWYLIPTFTITGTVELQNYIPGPAGVSVSVIVDGGIPMIKTLDAESKFTLTGMTAGTYNIYVKASHWLSQTQPIVVSEDTLAEYSLKNGDVDDDDFVGILDLEMMADNWLQQTPSLIEPGTDLNGDELVNGLDFCIMGANWYLSGE